MNRSNFELSIEYSSNHKRVCELSVSRGLGTWVGFYLAPFTRGEDKGEGFDSRTCDFSKRNPSPSPSPFSKGEAPQPIAYSSNQPQLTILHSSTKRFFSKLNGCSMRLFGE